MKLYLIQKKKGRRYTSPACANAAAGITLEYEPNGRPVALSPEPGPAPGISVSDTKRWWAMLTASGPCGLDIEEGSRNLTAASANKLHPLEQQYLSGLAPLSSEWREEFLSLWVRKEAYMKFCGEGLRLGLGRFSVLDESLDYAETVQAKDRPTAFVTALDPGRGLYAAAALACAEELEEVIFCSYEGEAEKEILDEAAELLSGRSYTGGEMHRRLRSRGFEAGQTEEAVERLKELGYIDDGAYARNYAADAAEKGKGKLRIARELAQKGLDPAETKAALRALEEDGDQLSERDRAMEAAQKMLRGEKPDRKALARVGRRLSSLGYEPSVIWDVLEELRTDE